MPGKHIWISDPDLYEFLKAYKDRNDLEWNQAVGNWVPFKRSDRGSIIYKLFQDQLIFIKDSIPELEPILRQFQVIVLNFVLKTADGKKAINKENLESFYNLLTKLADLLIDDRRNKRKQEEEKQIQEEFSKLLADMGVKALPSGGKRDGTRNT